MNSPNPALVPGGSSSVALERARHHASAEIEKVEVFHYGLHYAHGAYTMSDARAVTGLASTVVRVTDTHGRPGWGECCPLGMRYLPSFAGGVRAALMELAPALVGQDGTNLAAIDALMDATLRGSADAKSALNIACFDLAGHVLGIPVCGLLGGKLSNEFALYEAVPQASPGNMASYVTARKEVGIRHFQLKLGGAPNVDIERAAAVFAAVGDDSVVIGDANGGWSQRDARRAVRGLERLEGLILEQPCASLSECVSIRRATTMPVVLDEVITDLRALVTASQHDALDGVNIKLARVGGLNRARILRDLAAGLGLEITIEDTWGGDIVTAAVSHLAASTPPDALLTVSFMNDWVLDHIAGHHPRSAGGRGAAPDGPGLGIEVDQERLRLLASFGTAAGTE